MKLTEIERNTELWVKLKTEYEARLNKLRTENDREMTETATAKLRGQIFEIKKLLRFDIDKQEFDAE